MQEILVRAGCFVAIIVLGYALRRIGFFKAEDFTLLSKIVVKPVEESYTKQKSFITNASHDIKTPLTIISADTELVEMENGESQWTNDIKDQVKRLTSLTNKLVFLSKMEEEDFSLDLMEVDISSLLHEVVLHYEPLITASNKKIEIDIVNNITIKANEDKFNQMMYLLFHIVYITW